MCVYIYIHIYIYIYIYIEREREREIASRGTIHQPSTSWPLGRQRAC